MLHFSKLSKRKRLMIFAALGLSSCYLLSFFLISPFTKNMAILNRKIAINEKQLARALRNLNQKDELTQEYQKFVQYVKKEGSDDEEMNKMSKEINRIAQKNRVLISDAKNQQAQQSNSFKTYTIEVGAETRLAGLVSFLHELNQSSQLLRFENLRIRKNRKNKQKLNITLSITKMLVPTH